MKKFIVCCFSIIVAEISAFAAADQGAKIDPMSIRGEEEETLRR